ncbi:MAG: hypothetical protein JWP73_2176 [Phenylobacterium sp.]|nr:hypothetical protein [Phenylobacterium sp.]
MVARHLTTGPHLAFRGWAPIVVGLAACADVQQLAPMRAVEPPPAQYASGPTISGVTVERSFADLARLQAFCNFYLGRPARGYYQACYVAALDVVALPDRHAWPSAAERRQLRAHEWAHARGWRHAASATGSEP